MGAWAYCSWQGCERSLRKPTLRELVNKEQFCRDGHRNEPTGDLAAALGDLEEQVEWLTNLAAAAGHKPD